MVDIQIPMRIRAAVKDDNGFIFNSWLKSARKRPEFSHVTDHDYYVTQARVVEYHLEHGRVLVAVLEHNRNTILGYVVAEDKKVIWLYVKQYVRGIGIEDALQEAVGCDGSQA